MIRLHYRYRRVGGEEEEEGKEEEGEEVVGGVQRGGSLKKKKKKIGMVGRKFAGKCRGSGLDVCEGGEQAAHEGGKRPDVGGGGH